MAKDTQSRKWQITINNPKEKGFTHEKLKEILSQMPSIVYWCMADEVGEQGTYHTHLFFQVKSPMRFSTLKSKFPSAHYEMANGTAKQNREYVFKEGKWLNDKKADTRISGTQEEYGEMPIERQGQRNDLIDLYDMIKEGKTDFEILEEMTEYMMDIQKIEKVRQTIREAQFKDTRREVECIYIYGETGTGKTRGVMDKYGYSNVFRVTDYDHPFDGYKGQDVLVFEEFRSDLKISQILNYTDVYPLELPARYGNKIACFTKVYFITNIPLRDQYKKIQTEQPETFKAFMRRIQEVHEYEGNQIIKCTPKEHMAVNDMKVFRTDAEIENILNFAFYQQNAKNSPILAELESN